MWRLFKRWLRPVGSRWWAYPFAIAITGLLIYLFTIGGATRYASRPLGLLFAVLFSAYVGGLWPGLLSTLIIAAPLILLDYRQAILVPGVTLEPPTQFSWFPMVFGFMGGIISVLFEALHRSRRASDASQRELTATLANTSDAIITTDALGRIQYLNRTAALWLQCDLPAVVNQPFESVVKIRDATDATRDVPLLNQVLGSGHTVHIGTQQVLVRDDGWQLAIEATAAPVRDQAGQLVSVVMTIRDCTEQRKVENILRERLALQARSERIAAVVPGAIYEFRTYPDGHEQLLYASPAFKGIFGVDPESFAEDAAGLRNTLEPADTAEVREITEIAASALTPIYIEYRMRTPHRGLRWVATSAVPMREADGSTLWHGIFMDVTERKIAEERLRASQLQLRAALDAGAMGVFAINPETGVIELDSLARHLWNLDAVTDPVLRVEHLVSVLHPDDREAARAVYGQTKWAIPRAFNNEYRLLLDDGQERWLACRGRIYQDAVTGSLAGVAIVMDITQHRHFEAQRLHSQKMEALGVMAGGIAHDFNNLLLAISGNAKLLLADLSDHDPARTSVREIDKAALRATELVRRILSFSSVQELGHTGEPIALRPVLDEVLGSARLLLPQTVAISTDIADGLPDVLADNMQVHQAVTNLLANAADASLAVGGGTIELAAAAIDVDEALHHLTPEVKPGHYVCITVTDAGKGIEPAVLPRIFDPFFTTKAGGRGTGLGLAIVHGIMKSNDGAVTVRSTPDHGATFSLYFPARSTRVVTAEPTTASTAARRSAHILYVDDEESLVFLMTRTLERMGHRITACLSPEAALEKFMANVDEFDLVVSDMTMPELSGIELAERMLAVRPQLPFIITSGFVDATDAERAQAIGVHRMIMKPNTVDELSMVLTAILREQDVPTGAPL